MMYQQSITTVELIFFTSKKFRRLVAEWKMQRGPSSSSAKLAMHPAYQKIIGMGKEAIPLLLQELKREPDSWFWALTSITEEDPVAEEDQGSINAMAKAWLAWGRTKGYQID
jgi:hypothetical protein